MPPRKPASNARSRQSPPQFMAPERAALIAVGNTADDLASLAECDWIIEAIIEQPGPKRQLFEQLESDREPDGDRVDRTRRRFPIRSLVETRSDTFRRRFLGTHFFNPPRYLHLLEIIPTERTAPDVIASVRAFGERLLGKGIVVAQDVPGFIANRLGLYGMLRAIRLMQEFGLTIDEVDALTGPFIGRPKSATFRTGDISGIDVLSHVASGLSPRPARISPFRTGSGSSSPTTASARRPAPASIARSARTFTRSTGKPETTRRPRSRRSRSSSFSCRFRCTSGCTGSRRRAARNAEFLRKLLLSESHYTLAKTPEIAPDIVSVDRAMEWGYAWESGPFKQMDAMGLEFLRGGFGALGLDEPPLLRTAQESFYRRPGHGERYLTFAGQYSPVDELAGHLEPRRAAPARIA